MRIILSICMISLFTLNVQGQLNDYKYVIVPKKFEDFKKENQHLTSTLVKHLFTQKGFNTIYDDAIPDELHNNGCLGLRVDLKNLSSMFTTKVKLILEDCNGNSIFMTQEGRSKEKKYKVAFNKAITQAFNSIEALNYAYVEKPGEETVTLNFKNDVKTLKDETQVEKQTGNLNQNPSVQQEATLENQSFKSIAPKNSTYEKGTLKKETVVKQVATPTEQRYSDKTPVASNIQKASDAVTEKINATMVLYAQELPNGYQLIDSSPKIVMTLFKTSMKDVYAAKQGATNGLVFKKGEKWFFDYTQDEKLIQQELNIKF